MSFVSVRTSIDGALRKFDFIESEAKRAIVRALNKTAITARAQASREIRAAGYGIKSSDLKAAIKIDRASLNVQQASVRAAGRPIPLIKYGARQTKDGVSVSVKGSRKVISGAFIATMPNGHKGVFLRESSATHRRVFGRSYRYTQLPLRELFGPSIPSAFMNEAVKSAVIASINDRFSVVLDQELNYLRTKSRA